jgi:hypothetical protein
MRVSAIIDGLFQDKRLSFAFLLLVGERLQLDIPQKIEQR